MLSLPTKTRYAARILSRLALQTERLVAVHEIASDEGLSRDYTEQILTKLRAAGLVQSRRGSGGGFALSCDPADTTIMDVVRAVDGPVRLAPCIESSCDRSERCPTQAVWREANEALEHVFGGTSLATLAARARAFQSEAMDYQI